MRALYSKGMVSVKTHLMFQGDGDAALSLYQSVFPDFQVESVERYGEEDGGKNGTLKDARISFAGHNLIIFDSPTPHEFDFTPSVSIFVDFDRFDVMIAAFEALSEGGQIMMPPDDYGFSTQFAWIADRFGVSWQLNLPISMQA